MTVLSHARDTVAAHQAAEFMERSGKAKIHKARVIEQISKSQGATACELGDLTGLGHQEAQRRISDLKNDGLVEYGNRRRCKIKDSSMSEVFLTKHGAEIMNVQYVYHFQRGAA